MATIVHRLPAQAASDGAGVRIKRVSPGRNFSILDPFLMLDEIHSAAAGDYVSGFPAHPHRGFETITYMRRGMLEHQDHLGNRGIIEAGGAQWMTAGRGVIHSEMPMQKEGVFHGFQLWLNLPANEKMRDAEYHNLLAKDIPLMQQDAHRLHILGGRYPGKHGWVTGPIGNRTTDPHIWDIELNDDNELSIQLDPGLKLLLYAYQGNPMVNGEPLFAQQLVTTKADIGLKLQAEAPAKLLLLAGRPLAEPVAQYGPFVMNTPQQIEAAIRDYQAGTLI